MNDEYMQRHEEREAEQHALFIKREASREEREAEQHEVFMRNSENGQKATDSLLEINTRNLAISEAGLEANKAHLEMHERQVKALESIAESLIALVENR